MLGSYLGLLLLAAAGVADVPAGYKKVYITSMVNAKFVVQPKAAKAGSTVVVQTLTSKPEQQWYIKDGASKIQLADTTLCLDAGAKSKPLLSAPRSIPVGSVWRLTAGRSRMEGHGCHLYQRVLRDGRRPEMERHGRRPHRRCLFHPSAMR